MANNIEVVMTAKDASLVRAWQNAKNNIAAYEGQVQKLDGTQAKAAKSGNDLGNSVNWAEQAAGAMASAAGVISLGAALSSSVEQMAKLKEEATATVLEMDKLNRLYAIQAGLKGVDAEKASSQMIDIAEKNAVPVADVFSTSTQLSSSGYADPEKSGTTDAMLKILQSSNLGTDKGAEMAKSIGQFLTSFGKDKNASNLLDVGVRTRGLFKSTDVQLGDLSAFSQAAPSFANANVSMQDTLSALAILRESEAPEHAATHGRNVVSLMTTFASDKNKTETLKKMGLKPEDVDLTGETLPEGLGRLNQGFAGLKDDSERNLAKESLFGRENITGASILMGGVDKFKTFGGYQNDTEGFEHGVRIAQTGPQAAKHRSEAQKMRERQKYKDDLIKQNLLKDEFKRRDEETILDAQDMGAAGFFLGAGTAVKGKIRDAAIGSGLVKPSNIASPEDEANVQRNLNRGSDFKLDKLQKDLQTGGSKAGGGIDAEVESANFYRAQQQVESNRNLDKLQKDLKRGAIQTHGTPESATERSQFLDRRIDEEITNGNFQRAGELVENKKGFDKATADKQKKEAASAPVDNRQLLEALDRNTAALDRAASAKGGGQRGTSVTVNMPGAGAPAKPVAAAGIGNSSPR